ncbi:MAG: hypothetical protein AAF693_18665 [Bacteroidota bacterium]
MSRPSTDKPDYGFNENKKCLTMENFNSVVSYVRRVGKQIPLSKRIVSDKELKSLEISLNHRFIELIQYQNYECIIIIDKKERDTIPTYFVSNENNVIVTSAYNSRLETGDDLKVRANDWCSVVAELTNKK